MADKPISIATEDAAVVAIEYWRISKWLQDNLRREDTAAIRYAARRLKECMDTWEIEIMDLAGLPYDPGLPVRVVDSVTCSQEEVPLFVETLSPIVKCRGEVIKEGQAVVSSYLNEKRVDTAKGR